jgi:hypothetical protein
MPERDDHNEIARVTAGVLAVAERWLRPADQLDYVVRRWLIPRFPLRKRLDRCHSKRLRFSAADYRAIFKTQSDGSFAHNTPLSDPCLPGSLIFSKSLNSEAMRPQQLAEAVMRLPLE